MEGKFFPKYKRNFIFRLFRVGVKKIAKPWDLEGVNLIRPLQEKGIYMYSIIIMSILSIGLLHVSIFKIKIIFGCL